MLHRKPKASVTLFLAHTTMVVTCRSSSSGSSRLLFPPTSKVDRMGFHGTSRQEIDKKQARPFGGLRAGELDLNAQSLVFPVGPASTVRGVLFGRPATCGRGDHKPFCGSVPRLEGGKNARIVIPGYDSCYSARSNNNQSPCVKSKRQLIHNALVRGRVVRGQQNTRRKSPYYQISKFSPCELAVLCGGKLWHTFSLEASDLGYCC